MTWPTRQTDRFVHDRLPAPADMPDIVLDDTLRDLGPFNCVKRLLDRHIAAGHGAAPAILCEGEVLSYADLHERVCRIANVLVRHLGVVPGNRVLLRGFNSPWLAACWLAVEKVGGVAVTTMPLLRTGELAVILDMARPAAALCEAGISPELADAIAGSGTGCELLTWDGGDGGELGLLCARQPGDAATMDLDPQDIALIAFTSGTTGKPKATIHSHRDILAICQGICRHVIRPASADRFIGTAPLAFTFGLGGLLIFPLFAGASTVLEPRYTPEALLARIGSSGATVCFTVPTFYTRMAGLSPRRATGSLRMSVSSGEALPVPVRRAWQAETGLVMTEMLGATEMLHAFCGATGASVREGFIGPAVPGYELAVLDDDGHPLPPGEPGRLAVRGPTGCRYLDDPRQRGYVQRGWNITSDICALDADGYLSWISRLDDMIVSAGYNIAGVEVENALLTHPRVRECAVIGEPDEARGAVVSAYVVAAGAVEDEAALARELQDHVKAQIAPYKYPRRITFLDVLPRNELGKLQRFRLREAAPVGPEASLG